MSYQTALSIEGDDFLLNDQRTFPGRSYHGHRIEGLLPNARLIQGVFDDLNANTRSRWNYQDSE